MLKLRVFSSLMLAISSIFWGGRALAAGNDRLPVERSHSIVKGAGGVPLLVVEAGNHDGPAILFIHGMSQSHLSWDRQFTADLAKEFRLVAFDLRGHGGSAKPWDERDYSGSQIWADDVAAVIDGLKLDQVTIVAWSFGGYVAASYVRQYGARKLRAVNLVGTTGGMIAAEPPRPEKHADIMESVRLRGSLDLRENIEGYRTMPDNLTAKPMAARDRETAFLSGIMHPGYVRRVLTSLPLQNEDVAVKFNVPVLISIGSADIGLTVHSAAELALLLPNGTVSVYRGSGHFPAYEKAPRFNRELSELVRRSANLTLPRQLGTVPEPIPAPDAP